MFRSGPTGLHKTDKDRYHGSHDFDREQQRWFCRMNKNNSSTIVQAIGLRKQVSSPEGPLVILDDINLSIQTGESVAIVGASGSGKSTLLSLLAGLDTASSGKVVLAGKELGALDENGRAAVRAGQVGFVFQSFQLLPGMTALENVMLPLELAGNPEAEKEARAILQQVGLGARLRHYPNQLSGGEQQRVAIARAFAGSPKILFADEPTGNLDQRTGAGIIELLLALNKKSRTTLVLVTHDPELARTCSVEFHLDQGRLRS